MDPMVASAIDPQYVLGNESQSAQEQAAENKGISAHYYSYFSPCCGFKLH